LFATGHRNGTGTAHLCPSFALLGDQPEVATPDESKHMTFSDLFLRHFRRARSACPETDLFELRLLGLERHRAATLPGFRLFRKKSARRAA
jgi:hypothetical protein